MADRPPPVPVPPTLETSAVALTDAIRTRRLSCAELMGSTLDHIERLNPVVNAIVALQPREQLMAQARAADAAVASGRPLGPLHGLPFAVKDLDAVAGIVSTQGSPLFAGFVPDADSIAVERLRRAGVIFIGKTNSPEFGLGSQTYNTVYGTTGNAYDPSRTAGGSSGGAAVAVALRMLPVADGSDYGGSQRNPTGWNNVFGLRPSAGRIPTSSLDMFSGSMSVHGPIARSVPDLAVLLSVQAGFDPRVPHSLPDDPRQFLGSLERDIAGMRFAWLGDFRGAIPYEPGVLDLCRSAAAVLEDMGAIVEEAVPDMPAERLWDAWRILRAWQIGARFAPYVAVPEQRARLKPEAMFEYEEAAKVTALDIAGANQTRTEWFQAVLALFERYDALLAPTAQLFAFDKTIHWPRQVGGVPMHAYYDWLRAAIPITLSGCPAIAVPAGFGPENTPMGLQIVAPNRGERLCLEIAQAYDKATRWPLVRPSPLLARS